MGCNNEERRGTTVLNEQCVKFVFCQGGRDDEKLACQHRLIRADHIPHRGRQRGDEKLWLWKKGGKKQVLKKEKVCIME